MRIEVMPTLRCNLACKGCDRGTGHGPLHVDPDLKSFDNILTVYNKTVAQYPVEGFTVSGGEPTLYPKLIDMLNFMQTLISRPVDIKTNGILLLNKIPEDIIKKHCWGISVYTSSVGHILSSKSKLDELSNKGCVYFMRMFGPFDDLRTVDKTRPKMFDPRNCFMPTLICNIDRVYPCCRAHMFETVHKQTYSVNIEEYALDRLFSIIMNTDLCSHCSRCYECKTVQQ